jgi:citrate lyase subunit beta/citryl-CoA lyase
VGRRVTVRLERSTLVVPGSNWSMIAKAAASDADAVCIDLEDAVAPDAKAASRANVARAFAELDFGRKTRAYRINALDTPFAYRDLIEVIEAAGDRIDLVVVPKVDRPDDVRFVATLLAQIEEHLGLARPIGIEALIETAAGALNIREIAAATPRLEGFIYGSGDYAASLRMPMANIGEDDENDALYPGHRWHHVMHTIVTAARAHGLRAIDGPFAAFRDSGGLERACRIGRAMGFDGKWCIHPAQVETANRVYAPAPADIVFAERVLAELAASEAQGRGALSLDGKMIDAASVRMARATVEQARLAGLTE